MSFRRFTETATRVLVNGIPGGVAWAPDGSPFAVLALTVRGGRIVAIDVLADPDRLAPARPHRGRAADGRVLGRRSRPRLPAGHLCDTRNERPEGATHMSELQRIGSAPDAPRWVTIFTPVARPLLAARVPLGFNGLITIPGRTSGLPRTTPVAIIEVAGRRWVWSPWGDVHWVRNLRAAGGATITVRGRDEEVTRDRAGPGRAPRVLPGRPRSRRADPPVRARVHPHRRRGRPRRSGRGVRGPARLRAPLSAMTASECRAADPSACPPSGRTGRTG